MKKTTIAILAGSALLAVSTSAMPYAGTITETITGTDDPLYHVGQQFVCWYIYESPSIGGVFTFGPRAYPGPSTLTIELYYPFSPYNGSDPSGFQINRCNGSSQPQLTVSGGVVTDLDGVIETGFQGNWYMILQGFSFQTFETGRYDPVTAQFIDSPSTSGTFAFSDPIAFVPDNNSTLILLASVGFGMFFFVRKRETN